MINDYLDFVHKNGYFEHRRQEQAKYWMYETIDEQLRNNFYNNPIIKEMLEEKEERILNNTQTSFTAAHDVLEYYFRHKEQ